MYFWLSLKETLSNLTFNITDIELNKIEKEFDRKQHLTEMKNKSLQNCYIVNVLYGCSFSWLIDIKSMYLRFNVINISHNVIIFIFYIISYVAIFRPGFTKQGKLAWEGNPIKAPMAVESSAHDPLTTH